MKKNALLICIILVLTTLLSACAPAGFTLEKVIGDKAYEEEYPTLTKKEEITDLNGYSTFMFDKTNSSSINISYRELVFFQNKIDTIKVYNLETNRIILTLEKDNYLRSSGFECFDKTFLMVQTRDEINGKTVNSTTLYTANGDKITTQKGLFDADDIRTACDLFQLDANIYRVDRQGGATYVCDSTFVGNIPKFDMQTPDYYYNNSSDSITVYDRSLNTVLFWEPPYEVGTSFISVLKGDKILVQYLTALPDDEKNYDLILTEEGNTKYELTSLLINVANGKEKSLNLNYLVPFAWNTDSIITEKIPVALEGIDNIASIYRIEDKRVVTAESKMETVALDSNGKIKGKLFSDLENCVGSPEFVTNDRLIYRQANGDKILVDGEADVIGKFNSYSSCAHINEKYFVVGDKIYDFNLKMVYDLTANNYTVLINLAHGFILTDVKGNYFLFNNGNATEIDGIIDRTSKQIYIVVNKSDKYTVYNDLGTALYSGNTGDIVSVTTSYDDYYLIRITNVREDKISYIRIHR